MSYIKITNNGEINVNALKLLGASTKRGNANQIGFFGTGNKYALGYFLKNGVDVRMFSGRSEIAIDTVPVEFDGSTFDVITINGEQTSITTDIGPTWEAWHAVREFYSNAMDCGGESIDLVDNVLNGLEGTTTIYIDASSDEIKSVVDNLHLYFAIGRHAILDDGNVKVYTNGTGSVFRKGIRVNAPNTLGSTFDYDLTSVPINEMRLLATSYGAFDLIAACMLKCDDINLFGRFIKSLSGRMEKQFFCTNMVDWMGEFSGTAKQWFSENMIATEAMGNMLSENEAYLVNYLPEKLFSKAVEEIGTDNLLLPRKLGSSGKAHYQELEITRREASAIAEAKTRIESAGITVGYPISIAEFDKPNMMGGADMNRKLILIARKVFDMGEVMLISTILEELVHIRDNVKDETREMQDSLLNMVATMIVSRSTSSAKAEAA